MKERSRRTFLELAKVIAGDAPTTTQNRDEADARTAA
jgi:hypothetical protein